MPVTEILMPHYPHAEDVNAPVIYLAGSERTASNSWHETTTEKLRQNAHDSKKLIYVANPFEPDFTNAPDQELQDWQNHYIQRASHNGVYLVWLTSKETARDHPSIPKALRLKRKKPEMNIVVGAGSSGNGKNRFLLEKLLVKSGLQPPITSLEKTCKTALELIE